MAFIRVNDARIWYELTGEGPVLVQISGAVSGHEAYAPLTPRMAEHFTVLDFDHRGYGQSDRPEQRYTITTWADDLVALLDGLGIGSAHVHGGSMGGFIAVQFATTYPDRVDKLVIGGGVAKSDYVAKCYFRAWQDMARAYGIDSEELATLFMTTGFSRRTAARQGDELVRDLRDLTVRNTSLHVFTEACQAMIDCDVRDELGRITAPTLLMVGDEDRLTPLHAGPDGAGMAYMAEHIPNARLHVLEGCGHGHLFERPDESITVILDFLLGS